MSEAIAPTKERLRKSTFDAPHTDQRTDRKAYKARDVWDELLRKGEIEEPEHQAAGRWQHHYEGYLGHDVRIVDYTTTRVDDTKKSGWERHAAEIEAARSELVPEQFRALVLLTNGSDLFNVGTELHGYRSESRATAYALGIVKTALQGLAYMWEYRIKKPPSLR